MFRQKPHVTTIFRNVLSCIYFLRLIHTRLKARGGLLQISMYEVQLITQVNGCAVILKEELKVKY